MPGARSDSLDQGSAGFLATTPAEVIKPWASLWRLRPLRLAALARWLQDHGRRERALQLVREFFPAELDHLQAPDLDWIDILTAFLALVEQAGWFGYDRDSVELAWQAFMEDPELNEEAMAVFLVQVPVELYGLSGPELLADRYLPLSLLKHLLDETTPFTASAVRLLHRKLNLEKSVVTDWSDAARQAAWQRLADIEARPERYPEPVRRLPALAHWACGNTGNRLLDRSGSCLTEADFFTWQDVPALRRDWLAAEPLLQLRDRLAPPGPHPSDQISQLSTERNISR
jgi:hypothetical protein